MSTPHRHQRFRSALTGDSYATTLLAILIDEFGTKPLYDPDPEIEGPWDPTTIAMELEETFDVTLPRQNFDRLMAAIRILTTDEFYHSLPDFIWYCNILSGDTMEPGLWDPAEADEIAWGITEALLLDAPESPEPFAPQIRQYIGAVMDMQGIVNPPDVLKIAIRGKNPAGIVGQYSDDPLMYEMVYQTEAAKTQSIHDLIRNNLIELNHQLAALPLRDGDARDAVRTALQNLGETS